jgi:uroporphyrinogen III methyltransferase/synthase
VAVGGGRTLTTSAAQAARFTCIDMKKTKIGGIVYLVGAGPGDPGLITVRGKALLEQAHVVVYDALSDPRLLSHAPAAEHIYVGKRAASHTFTQDQISQLLVDLGQQGKRVVRLKGGDPFVFGRGGEECEALLNAGVAFEVVPGITAAIAAPCYAGIPVTHRDFNSSFTLITGHEKEEQYQDPRSHGRQSVVNTSDLDWSAIAKLPCIAFYMGVKALPRICTKLIEHGMSPDIPAATIQWGTTARQRTVVATVVTLPQAILDNNITPPAMTIIGRVVTLRETMSWFEKRPLFGQTIVVTRTRQQASDLTAKLEDLGASVIEAPTIEIAPAKDSSHIDQALARLRDYDWIIFTSANGVIATKQKLTGFGLDARDFGNAKIAAIGDATADAVRRELCLNVDLCPETFIAEALADELTRRGEVGGRKFLLLRADIARPILRVRLEEGGAAQVHDIAIYETPRADNLPPHLLAALGDGRINCITFTSSSTARNFVELLGADYKRQLKGIALASIGPITTATLNELGLPPTIEAKVYNIDGLVEAIMAARQ